MKGYRLSILRHGMTEANAKGIYIGKTDTPLSDKGAAQLAAKMDEFACGDTLSPHSDLRG